MRTLTMSNGNHSGRPVASDVTDAIMRATAILVLMGIAVIHLVQLVPTFKSTPLLGLSFVGLIVGSVTVGARLIRHNLTHTQLWLPAAALGVASIGGYIFTRVVSTPLDNQDIGNWSCMLGMAALFIEATLVGLSAYALSGTARSARVPAHAPVDQEAAGRFVAVTHANGSRV